MGFFWGEDLTPRSLAEGMLSARCAYGVHLDMNGANTGFEFMKVTPERATAPLGRPLSAGEAEGNVPSAPGYRYRVRRMVRGMHEMSFPRYIKRDPRDYFYLMLRAVLPGPALAPPVTPAQPHEGEKRQSQVEGDLDRQRPEHGVDLHQRVERVVLPEDEEDRPVVGRRQDPRRAEGQVEGDAAGDADVVGRHDARCPAPRVPCEPRRLSGPQCRTRTRSAASSNFCPRRSNSNGVQSTSTMSTALRNSS